MNFLIILIIELLDHCEDYNKAVWIIKRDCRCVGFFKNKSLECM